MICPVCKLGTGYYTWPNVNPGGPLVSFSYPLYQRSYKGSDGYISPRCSECYDKAERRLMGKRDRERIARIEAGEEEPIAPRKKPEEEVKEEEEQASDELMEALHRISRRTAR